MNVSVVIPAHNEGDNIQNVIESVLVQETKLARVLEVIVVASGCTDDTAELARAMTKGRPGMSVHVQERRAGKVAALNEYLKMRDPRAEIIVCLSADLELAPDVIERVCQKFANEPKVGMVGGHVVPNNDPSTLMGKVVHILWSMHHEVAQRSPKMGELIAFRGSLIERVSELSIVDEASVEDIIRSKGFDLGYVPEAIVTNHGPETLTEYFEQRRRIARGHYWLEFAFGYEVATLNRGLLWDLTRDTFVREDAHGRKALAVAVGVEALARAVGFFDARVVGGKRRTWKPLRSTKKLK
jgi:cellulose synthase/poly-beta-1,6-N-acetylglucosamine synthase-like glycosyltransferase